MTGHEYYRPPGVSPNIAKRGPAVPPIIVVGIRYLRGSIMIALAIARLPNVSAKPPKSSALAAA